MAHLFRTTTFGVAARALSQGRLLAFPDSSQTSLEPESSDTPIPAETNGQTDIIDWSVLVPGSQFLPCSSTLGNRKITPKILITGPQQENQQSPSSSGNYIRMLPCHLMLMKIPSIYTFTIYCGSSIYVPSVEYASCSR